MDKTLLVEKREAGYKLISYLKKERLKFSAAFWSFSSEKQSWQLVIATTLYDELGPQKTYSLIQNVLKKHHEIETYIKLYDIRAISHKNRVLKELRNKLVFQSFPLDANVYMTGFSGDLIENVYVYQLRS